MEILKICVASKPKVDTRNYIVTDLGEFWSIVDRPNVFERMLALITAHKLLEIAALDGIEKGDYALRALFTYQEFVDQEIPQDVGLYILRAMEARYGALTSDETLVFVDEFQNYSATELSVLKNAFASAVFNFYGDFDQRIEEKGADLRKNITALFSPSIFNLNTNYRNAKQITQYINQCVHKNMIPIGLSGTVLETSVAKCVFERKDRTAILCKDPRLAMAVLKNFIDPKTLNPVYDTQKIDSDRISVMSVLECKGLEFDTVYVFCNGMTEHEMYVAYTRALDRLVVLSDSLLQLKSEIEEAKKKEKEQKRQKIKKQKTEQLRKEEIAKLANILLQEMGIRKRAIDAENKKKRELHLAASRLVTVLNDVMRQKEHLDALEKRRKQEEAERKEAELRRKIEIEEQSSDEQETPQEMKIEKDQNHSDLKPNPAKSEAMNDDMYSEQKRLLEEELQKIREYRQELERREAAAARAEEMRNERIYSLAVQKLESDDAQQLKEAITLFETVLDYKNSVALAAKARGRINELRKKAENTVRLRRRNKKCQHCGGSFKGLLTKTCIACGRKKDY